MRRQPKGAPTGGEFAADYRPEAGLALAVDPTAAADFDALALAAEHPEHDLAHLGIHTITLPGGRKVAHNTNGAVLVCPVCHGVKAQQANCSDCFGRGVTANIPFCERPWDEVSPGLSVGGHDCQPEGGDCQVTDQFDVVISLYSRDGYGPGEGTEHHTHTMIDGPLDTESHAHLHRLADAGLAAIERGESVLVRCQAGMNRSGLVTAMIMMKSGWTAQAAIARMREVRGPYMLFNEDFQAYLATHEDEIRGGRVVCETCHGRRGSFGVDCEACAGNGWA